MISNQLKINWKYTLIFLIIAVLVTIGILFCSTQLLNFEIIPSQPPPLSSESKKLTVIPTSTKLTVIPTSTYGGYIYDVSAGYYSGPSWLISSDNKKVFYKWYNDDNDKEVVVIESLDSNSKLDFEYPSKFEVGDVVFSPDSKRVAWVITDCSIMGHAEMAETICNESFVVIDGKEDKHYKGEIYSLQFDPSSKKIAYIVVEEDKKFVVVDGKEQKYLEGEYGEPLFVFSPDGEKLAYAANNDKDTFLVINDKEGKNYNEAEITQIVFSPDSQKLAYVVNDFEDNFVVIENTNDEHYESERYNEVRNLFFNLQTQSFGYFARKEDKIFFIVSDDKIKEYQAGIWHQWSVQGPIFSSNGKGIGYMIHSDGTITDNVGCITYFNGREFGKEVFVEKNSNEKTSCYYSQNLTISADGENVIYSNEIFTVHSDPRWGLVQDWLDEPHNVAIISNTGTIITFAEQKEKAGYGYFFSPSSNKIASLSSAGSSEESIGILDKNGKVQYKSKYYYDYIVQDTIEFSPDEKYIMYIARNGNEIWRIVEEITAEAK